MSRPSRIPGTTSRPRIMWVLPEIPDGATDRFKNGIAIRNVASTSGICPDCGTRAYLAGPDKTGLMHIVFEHENDCRVLLDKDAA